MKNLRFRWAAMLTAVIVSCCMLSFYQPSGAAPAGEKMPFGNSVGQRNQMIRELQEIKALMKEQNALLREVVKNSTDERKKP